MPLTVETEPKREPITGPLAIIETAARDFKTHKLERAARVRRVDDGEDVETDGGSYTLRNGVAIVSIVGALAQYGGWWYDGHSSVQARMMHAILDPRVSAVMVEINSPGSVIGGAFDAARAVRAAARESGKRVFVFAADIAYSGGYVWACVGDEIHLPDTGGVGSIGVIGTIESYARMNSEAGIDIVLVRSGSKKAENHPDGPIDPDAVAREKIEVDRLARIFAEFVVETRGRTADEFLALEGATVHGPAAVAAGLADSVTTFSAVLAMAEAAGRQRQMQQIAARLGLAATASEADINNEITRREVEAAAKLSAESKTRAEAEAKVDVLAACSADLAVRCGVITTGQRDNRLAYLKAAPAAAAAELASAEPILPAPRRESSEGAQNGSAYKQKKSLAVEDFAKMSEPQRAELAVSDRATYDKLRAEYKAQCRGATASGKGS